VTNLQYSTSLLHPRLAPPPAFDFPRRCYSVWAWNRSTHVRIEYSWRPPALDESLFARISNSSDDEANLVIARDRTCFALLNATLTRRTFDGRSYKQTGPERAGHGSWRVDAACSPLQQALAP